MEKSPLLGKGQIDIVKKTTVKTSSKYYELGFLLRKSTKHKPWAARPVNCNRRQGHAYNTISSEILEDVPLPV